MKKQNKTDPALNNPHNNFFQKNFSNKKIAKGYFRESLPVPIVQMLDFRTLKLSNETFLDENLKPYYSDLVYTCKWKGEKKVYLSIILEHQSKKPAIPHLKMLRYLLNAYDYQVEQFAAAPDKKKAAKTLSIVIPMFLYHGKTRWEYRPFHEFFEPQSEHLFPFIPNFVYLLNNLTTTPDEELLKLQLGYMVATLLLLKHYRDTDYIIEQTSTILSYASDYSEEKDWLDVFIYRTLIYISSGVKVKEKEVIQIIESVSKKLKDPVMTAYDKIISKAEKRGEEKGIEKGLEKGVLLQATKMVTNLIKMNPNFSDEELAKAAEVSVAFIQDIRSRISVSSG